MTISGAAAAGDATVITGNFIGVNSLGNAPLPNTGSGIVITAGTGVQIGGANAGDGNVISNNGAHGIQVTGGNGAVIKGNLIGTDKTGKVKLGNTLYGISVENNVPNTQIGGLNAPDANIISGNGKGGINDKGQNTKEQGNKIGKALDGSPLGNGGSGIAVAATNGLIQQNDIAFNSGIGVEVDSGTGNAITQNSIAFNTALGIDLGGDGVTANTPGGPHTGPNDLQNYPVLTSAVVSGVYTTITGTLNSAPAAFFTLEFFGDTVADRSGHGQGEQYLGSTSVTTDSSGNASFTITFPSSFGSFVAATATDQSGNTSEFSADVAAQQAGVPSVTGVSPTSGPTGGGTTVTITGSNFIDVSSVQFGGVAASFTVNSPTQITATSPAHAAGTVDVTVTNPAGTSAANSGDRYTYVVPVPVVTGVSPNSGPTSGGTTVTITGTGLAGTTLVSFGTTPAAGYLKVTDTSVTVLSPAHAGGIVDITVTTPGGTSSTSPRDQFTFGGALAPAAPALAAAAAPAGPAPAFSAAGRPAPDFAAAAALAAAGSSPAGPATDTSAGPRPAPVPVDSRDDRSLGQSTLAAVRDVNLAADVPSGKGPAPSAAEVVAADLVPPDTDPLQPPA